MGGVPCRSTCGQGGSGASVLPPGLPAGSQVRPGGPRNRFREPALLGADPRGLQPGCCSALCPPSPPWAVAALGSDETLRTETVVHHEASSNTATAVGHLARTVGKSWPGEARASARGRRASSGAGPSPPVSQSCPLPAEDSGRAGAWAPPPAAAAAPQGPAQRAGPPWACLSAPRFPAPSLRPGQWRRRGAPAGDRPPRPRGTTARFLSRPRWTPRQRDAPALSGTEAAVLHVDGEVMSCSTPESGKRSR